MNYYDDYNNRRKFVSHMVEFDKDQMFEISTGNLMGLSVDQIALYARPEWSYLIMRHIKHAMLELMDMDKVKYMADPRFNYPQMNLIKRAFDEGLSIDDVKQFSGNDNMSYSQMHDMYTEMMKKKKAMD